MLSVVLLLSMSKSDKERLEGDVVGRAPDGTRATLSFSSNVLMIGKSIVYTMVTRRIILLLIIILSTTTTRHYYHYPIVAYSSYIKYVRDDRRFWAFDGSVKILR